MEFEHADLVSIGHPIYSSAYLHQETTLMKITWTQGSHYLFAWQQKYWRRLHYEIYTYAFQAFYSLNYSHFNEKGAVNLINEGPEI